MKSSSEQATRRSTPPTDRLRVGIAEYAVSTDGTELSTSGLGSCVGIALYDEAAGVAGLAHVMLPSADDPSPIKPAKYADTGTVVLIEEMEAVGASRDCVVAKIAGGSNMLDIGDPGESVSRRNVEAVQASLDDLGVPIVAEHVGGNHGRSLEVRPDSGELFIRAVQGENQVL